MDLPVALIVPATLQPAQRFWLTEGCPRPSYPGAMKRLLIVLLAILMGLAIAQDEAQQPPSMAELLQQRDDLSTFTDLLERTGLLAEVADPGSFTLFAPTNDAFAALDDDAFAELQSMEGVIEEILRNHIALGGSAGAALERMGTFTNIAGYQFFIVREGSRLFVDAATVLEADLLASNGYVHVIDTVLIPEPYFPVKNQSTIPAGGTSRGTD